MVAFAICFFFFEIFEETFTASIVKRITFLRKRLHNIKRVEKLPEGEGSGNVNKSAVEIYPKFLKLL